MLLGAIIGVAPELVKLANGDSIASTDGEVESLVFYALVGAASAMAIFIVRTLWRTLEWSKQVQWKRSHHRFEERDVYHWESQDKLWVLDELS